MRWRRKSYWTLFSASKCEGEPLVGKISAHVAVRGGLLPAALFIKKHLRISTHFAVPLRDGEWHAVIKDENDGDQRWIWTTAIGEQVRRLGGESV